MINPTMGGMAPMGNPMGNMQQFMQRFQQFRQSFQGNPQQQIQQMLNSGTISQEKYNWAYQQAQQLQKMLGGK